MTIPFLPRPHVPAISFFKPISVNPSDWMTSPEYLLGILKKINELVAQVNKDSELIGQIEVISAKVDAMEEELNKFETDITAEIEARFIEIITELNATIETVLTQANAYTDTRYNELMNLISQIVIGDITVYDPTTGLLSPLQTVINNLFDTGREEALSAAEYDGLKLSATAYDAYELTASEYDVSGKTLLV